MRNVQKLYCGEKGIRGGIVQKEKMNALGQ